MGWHGSIAAVQPRGLTDGFLAAVLRGSALLPCFDGAFFFVAAFVAITRFAVTLFLGTGTVAAAGTGAAAAAEAGTETEAVAASTDLERGGRARSPSENPITPKTAHTLSSTRSGRIRRRRRVVRATGRATGVSSGMRSTRNDAPSPIPVAVSSSWYACALTACTRQQSPYRRRTA